MNKLIAGNWKMNGLRQDGVRLAQDVAAWAAAERRAVDLALFPPATLIAAVIDAIAAAPVAVGGQDCHGDEKGAHTGDISAVMLADLGCRYVIAGHSERRQNHGEDDATVAAKAAAAHRANLTAIICVGETAAEREAGAALAVVGRQLRWSLPKGSGGSNTIIAYEPVWAIGTGSVASPADVGEMHAAIRAQLAGQIPDGEQLKILYGGSVKPENAGDLLRIPNVDGALVGGASLDAAAFTAIAAAAG